MLTVDLPKRHVAAGTLGQCVPALRGFLVRAQKAVPLPGTVGVALISDPAIRKLNRDFRGLDHATDVLSFPAAMLPEDISQGKTHPVIRGDLAVSVDAAARQAKRFGHPLQSELKILILHGLLHLAGHDHENDRGEMGVAEERLRRRFRLPSALIARTLPSSPILPSRART